MSNKGTCLYCGKEFVRRHPSQKFCGKRKSGRHLCKDRWHNRERWPETVERLTGRRPDDWDAYADSIHPFSPEAFHE